MSYTRELRFPKKFGVMAVRKVLDGALASGRPLKLKFADPYDDLEHLKDSRKPAPLKTVTVRITGSVPSESPETKPSAYRGETSRGVPVVITAEFDIIFETEEPDVASGDEYRQEREATLLGEDE